MATIELHVARIAWLIGVVDLLILGSQRTELARALHAEVDLFLRSNEVLENHRGVRTGLRLRPWTVARFVFGEHASEREPRRVTGRRFTPGGLPSGEHVFEIREGAWHTRHEIDPTDPGFGCEFSPAGTHRRHVPSDRVGCVHQTRDRMHE